MQSGKGEMGTHKHGVSGRFTHNKSDNIQIERQLNSEAERKNSIKKSRMALQGFTDKIRNLFNR